MSDLINGEVNTTLDKLAAIQAAAESTTSLHTDNSVWVGEGWYNAFAITKSDVADLADTVRGVWVGGAGNIKVDMEGTGTAITFVGIPAGTFLPVRATKVYSTDTTATDMVGVY